MTLYLIGIGLNDEKDITLKGLETVKMCSEVYLECYTSKLNCSIESLERLYDKKIILADRDLVEKKAEDTILKKAKDKDVAFLVIGDVFTATTHIDLLLRAKEKGIKTSIINNASIITAIGITGLEVYKFGYAISIPFNNQNLKSPIERFNMNFNNGFHTLFLLDIDAEKGRYMTFAEAADYLIRNKVDGKLNAIGCTLIGSDDPTIIVDKLKSLQKLKVSEFPQSLIIPSKKLHFIEEESLGLWQKAKTKQ